MQKALLSIWLLAWTLAAAAQSGTIEVRDAHTNALLPYATLSFEELNSKKQQHCLSNDKGTAPNLTQQRSVLCVSFVGYKAFVDTLAAGQSLRIALEPNLHQLADVTIAATYSTQKADQSIYNVRVIDSHTIHSKAATNLSELLANELNLRISNDASLGSSLSIKGLSGNNVKILIDGVPLIGRLDGNLDLTQISLHNIDHIELVEGPLSVIYGSNSLAGVLNIVTKNNQRGRLQTGVNAYHESVGSYNFDANLALKRRKHTVSLAFGRNFFGGYDQDTLRAQTWKPKELYTTDASYQYAWAQSQLRLSTNLMQERLLMRGNLLPPYYETAFDSWFRTQRINTRAEYVWKRNTGLSLNVLGAYSFYARSKNTYFKDLSTLSEVLAANASEQDTTYYHAQLLRAVINQEPAGSKWQAQAGLDLNRESTSGKRIAHGQQAMGDYAVFASLRYAPSPQFNVQPGLRWAINDQFRVPLVPSFHIKYQPSERIELKASAARGYRAPSLKELYINFVDVNHHIVPNPELQPEYGYNLDFNSSYAYQSIGGKRRLDATLGLFYNDMHNIMQLGIRRLANDSAYQYINVSFYRSLGGSVQLSYKQHPYLSFSLGAMLTGMYHSFDQVGTSLSDFRYTTDLNASTTLRWPQMGLSLSAYYKYNGQSPQFYLSDNEQVGLSHLSAWHTLDVSANRSFWANRLALSIGAKNLFDNRNIALLGGRGGSAHSSGSGATPVAWGRSYFLKLSFNLQQ